MKYAVVLLFLCIQFTSFAQKDGMILYAYEQKVIPGIAPARDIAEGGKVVKKTSQAEKQYFIFLTTPDTLTIYPVSVWIKGKAFGVRAKESAAPVERQSTNDSNIVLVPKTTQKVVRLFPVEQVPGKKQWGATFAKQNELVLVYKLKGQHHYLVKEKFERLDASHLQ